MKETNQDISEVSETAWLFCNQSKHSSLTLDKELNYICVSPYITDIIYNVGLSRSTIWCWTAKIVSPKWPDWRVTESRVRFEEDLQQAAGSIRVAQYLRLIMHLCSHIIYCVYLLIISKYILNEGFRVCRNVLSKVKNHTYALVPLQILTLGQSLGWQKAGPTSY